MLRLVRRLYHEHALILLLPLPVFNNLDHLSRKRVVCPRREHLLAINDPVIGSEGTFGIDHTAWALTQVHAARLVIERRKHALP